ncbi:MAG TPA: hypothetical protein DEF42_01260 [Desulfosporosinus sp.]|nr:hypothetical protein [Desulfosporosinus sp.]
MFCKCSCEKIQYVDSYDLVNGKTKQCRQCSDTEAGLKKKYSHEQYLKRLVEIGSNVKVKEGCFYKGNGIKLTHVCTVCGGDWKVKPNVVLNGSTMCLKCSHSANESLMAIALKQLFKHYYPKTEWECDLGFRGKFGGVSPYDIYVPELNLVVECQSQYHDDSEHRELDLMKRRYALDKGYLYKEIDHRNISVLEAIQQFFPELNEVPDYVDLTKNVTRSWSLERAQELLNKGFSYKDVSEAVNTRKQSIASAVMKRQLVMPVGYIPRNKREWSLEEAQKLLNEERYTYSKISEILGKGCTTDAISMAVTQGLLIRAKYKAKRIIRNPRRQRIAIVQLNLDGEIVNRYEGISFIQGFGRGAVSNACKGKGKCKDVTRKHEYMGYQWYYEDDDN